MKRAVAVLSLAVLFASTQATPVIAASGYGAAGCGLGSMIFGNDPSKVKQVLAATTNGTVASQTFGITTGTLNCDASGTNVTDALEFIEGNREILAKDAARGRGETIAGLSQIAGCASPDAVGAALQSQYREIFTSGEAQVSDRVIEALKAPALGCTMS